MSPDSRIFVAGHRGMVGSAIVRQLSAQGGADIIMRDRSELDLTRQAQVDHFFEIEKPDMVYLAAAKVGGIHANNTYPADFIFENMMIQANVIEAAFRNGVKRLMFLGSSCIYPREAQNPLSEESLLSGKLEATNEPYAIAKIAGIKLCESYNRQYGKSHGIDYRAAMPSNLYGPGDNYHQENSHVIPALIRKFHKAKEEHLPEVTIWGTGTPKREFLYVDDLAKAAIYVMTIDKETFAQYTDPMCYHVNIGSGADLTIMELAELIKSVVGYNGEILTDPTKPDGTMRKLMDSTRINALGWMPDTSLEEGLNKSYSDFLKQDGIRL